MSRSGCDALKDEGSKLQTEVEKVRTDYQKLLEENKKLSLLVNLWNKSSVSLEKIQELHKYFVDKTGLGFSCNECTTFEIGTQSQLDNGKGKYIKFVKSNVTHEEEKTVIHVERNVTQQNSRRHFGIGYVQLERSNPSVFGYSKGSALNGHTSMNARPYQY